jgi:WD40 repeat protein
MTLVAQVDEAGASDLSWMPSGEALALAKPSEVVVVNTSPAAPVTGTVAMTPTLLTTSPDNSAVAWANQDNRVELWTLPTQTVELTQTTPGTAGVTGLAFSPSGDELAAANSDNQLSVWNPASGQLEQSIQLPYWLSGLSYSPDGKFLAGVDLSNFTVHILDAATGQEIHKLAWTDTASPALYGAVFSPDWKTVAWFARGTVQLMDVATGSMGPALSHEDFINDLSWSPDGSLIATASAATVNGSFAPAVYVWDAASGQQVNLIPQQNVSMRLDFSPDGKSLAILDSNGIVHLYASAANP